MDKRSKLAFRLASTEWFKIINYDDFTFYGVDKEKLQVVIKGLEKNPNPIGLTLRKTRFDLASPSGMDEVAQISRLMHLTQLVIPDQMFDWPVSYWMCLTTLTNLQHFQVKTNFHVDLTDVLVHFPNLTTLQKILGNHLHHLPKWTKLENITFIASQGNIEFFEGLKFPEKLISLDIIVASMFATPGIIKLDTDILTRLTRLKHLHWIHPQQCFPHSLLPNLEDLKVSGSPVDRLDLNTNLTSLSLYIMDSLDQQTELIGLTKIKSLAISFSMDHDGSFEYLAPMKELEQFSFRCNNELFLHQLCSSIGSTKLKNLSLSSSKSQFSSEISRLVSLEELTLNFSASETMWLTCLTNLTSLTSKCSMVYDEEYIYNIVNLKKLVMSNQVYEPYEGGINLSNLTNLEDVTMDLHFYEGYTVSGFDRLARLKTLDITCDREYDISFLDVATDLQDLKLGHRAAIGFWNVVTNLTSLRGLTVKDGFDDENLRQQLLLTLTRLTRLV